VFSWVKLLLMILVIPLNTLFQDDSSDSGGDLADELKVFFHFMAWNALSEEEQEQKQSFIEDGEWESSISASDLLAVFDDFSDTRISNSSIRSLSEVFKK